MVRAAKQAKLSCCLSLSAAVKVNRFEQKFLADGNSVWWYAGAMNHLPAELQDMVEQSGDTPVRVVDPRTQRVYVIIADEQFDRLRSLIDLEPLSLDQQRVALRDAGRRAGWDDPEMDAYDHYDSHQPPS